MPFCVRSRLLEQEAKKRAELEQIHLRQQRAISKTEAEKEELEKEREAKESALRAAMSQLEQLEQERKGALMQYQVGRGVCWSPENTSGFIIVSVTVSVLPCASQNVMKKLEDATNNTKSWKHKVAEHEGLLRLIQPGKHTCLKDPFICFVLCRGQTRPHSRQVVPGEKLESGPFSSPGSKPVSLVNNWGMASFSVGELSLREKQWQESKNQVTQAQ